MHRYLVITDVEALFNKDILVTCQNLWEPRNYHPSAYRLNEAPGVPGMVTKLGLAGPLILRIKTTIKKTDVGKKKVELSYVPCWNN